jgi:biopolymer transport protein ExbD
MSRKSRANEEAAVEADLIPIMNIMFLLIPALLLAMEFASMAAINVSPPRFSSSSTPRSPTSEPELALKVMIREDGFLLTAHELGVTRQEDAPKTISARAELGEDKLDYAALASQARALKDAFPTAHHVTVSAEANIPMDALIKTLDTLRGDGCRLEGVYAGERAAPRECMFWQPIISAVSA